MSKCDAAGRLRSLLRSRGFDPELDFLLLHVVRVGMSSLTATQDWNPVVLMPIDGLVLFVANTHITRLADSFGG